MSEFYASFSFLDKMRFFAQYYSIMTSLQTRINEINSQILRLRWYSGFGIETQIANMKRCSDQLKDYREDINNEYKSIVKIIDSINDHEKRAKSILGSVFKDEYKTTGYDTVASDDGGYNVSGKKNGFSKIADAFKDFLDDYILGYGKNIYKIVKETLGLDWVQKAWGASKAFKDGLSRFVGPIFDGLNIFSKGWNVVERILDGSITTGLGIASTLKDGVSISESALKIYQAVKGLDKLPGALGSAASTYLPVAGVLLTSAISGIETYQRVTADGDLSLGDIGEIAIDAGVDGGIAAIEFAVVAACPPAAIGVAIFEIADMLVENIGGTSLKDYAKSGIKNAAKWAGEKTGEAIEWVGDKVSDAADWVGGKVNDAANWIGDKFGWLCGAF